jgi:protein-S-isoprenylcysteine O-methyltransferase Ste14
MKVSVGKVIAEMVAVYVGYALLLFLPAGTLRWGAAWVFLGIYVVVGTAMVLWLLKVNPGLLNERMTGLGKSDQKSWDRPLMMLLIALYVVWVAVMPLDAVRFRWSHMPLWAQVAGGALYCISFYMLFLTYRENSFLSPAVRIQEDRGQTVVSTGPYRYVRHPMYASLLVQFIGASLLLGSWVGLLVTALILGVVARRAVLEEAALRDELPGYEAYMTHVRYRLIPGVW